MVKFINRTWIKRLCTGLTLLWLSVTIHAQKISASFDHVLYICGDSLISAIGNNDHGQLGDGTYNNRYSPVSVKGLQHVTAVNAIGSMALLSDGSVWQWSTEVGDYNLNPIFDKYVVSISAGEQEGGKFYCAVKTDGSLWVWGDRYATNDTIWGYTYIIQNINLPGVRKVAGGSNCIIALCADSSVWTWGYISSNGSSAPFPNPQMWIPQKVQSLSGVVDIAAGAAMTTVCALKNDGTVWVWGHSDITTLYYPSQLSNISNVKAIFTGDNLASDSLSLYALQNDGTIQIIDGQFEIPTIIPITNIKNISGITGSGTWNNTSTFVMCITDSIWRWGMNSYGQLGNGTTYPVSSPEVMADACAAVNCDTILNPVSVRLDTSVYPRSKVLLKADYANELYNWYPAGANFSCPSCQKTLVTFSAIDSALYTVVITDQSGCQRQELFEVHKICDSTLFHNPPLLLDTVTYPDNPIPLMATADTSYMWVPSSGLNCTTCQNPIATVSQSTTYLVTRTDSFDCPSKEKFRVLIRTCDTIQSDTVLTKLDTTLYRSAEITLHASTSYNGYAWFPVSGLSCNNCAQPELMADKTSVYLVSLTDQWLCPYQEKFIVNVVDLMLVIPNVITPNGDGINDYFVIPALVPHTSLTIIDNRGVDVFSSENYQNNWNGTDSDGKALNEGTYWYILSNPQIGVYKGWIYLKR